MTSLSRKKRSMGDYAEKEEEEVEIDIVDIWAKLLTNASSVAREWYKIILTSNASALGNLSISVKLGYVNTFSDEEIARYVHRLRTEKVDPTDESYLSTNALVKSVITENYFPFKLALAYDATNAVLDATHTLDIHDLGLRSWADVSGVCFRCMRKFATDSLTRDHRKRCKGCGVPYCSNECRKLDAETHRAKHDYNECQIFRQRYDRSMKIYEALFPDLLNDVRKLGSIGQLPEHYLVTDEPRGAMLYLLCDADTLFRMMCRVATKLLALPYKYEILMQLYSHVSNLDEFEAETFLYKQLATDKSRSYAVRQIAGKLFLTLCPELIGRVLRSDRQPSASRFVKDSVRTKWHRFVWTLASICWFASIRHTDDVHSRTKLPETESEKAIFKRLHPLTHAWKEKVHFWSLDPLLACFDMKSVAPSRQPMPRKRGQVGVNDDHGEEEVEEEEDEDMAVKKPVTRAVPTSEEGELLMPIHLIEDDIRTYTPEYEHLTLSPVETIRILQIDVTPAIDSVKLCITPQSIQPGELSKNAQLCEYWYRAQ